MNRSIPRCGISTTLCLVLLSSVRADLVLSVNPVADALVSSANPDSNYGGAGALEISAAGFPNGEFLSVLRFDLSSVKAGFDAQFGAAKWAVTGVTLTLGGESPSPLPAFFNDSVPGQIAVTWMTNTTWSEGTGAPRRPSTTGITFNSLAGLRSASDQSMGSFNFNGQTSGASTYSLIAASGFLGDLQLGGMSGILLSAADSKVSALFTSTNNSSGQQPQLSITGASTVPEPSSFAIVGIAAAVGSWYRLHIRRGMKRLSPRPRQLSPE